MPTYATLREQILLALDINPATTNDDTVDLVDYRMKQVVDKVVSDLNPVELLTEAMKNVTSATTSIALGGGGFAVTDLAEIFAISVDPKTSATRSDVLWEPVSRELWLMSKSAGYGDEIPRYSWTLGGSDTFYLSEWPTGSATWDVYLHYYRETAAVTDLGVPEIPSRYQQAIVVGGTVMGFPHRFQGDRQMTFAVYQQEYQEALTALSALKPALSKDVQLRTRKSTGANSIITWPGFQTS